MNAPFDTSAPLTEAELDRREMICRELAASAGEVAMDGFRKTSPGSGFSMKGPQDYLTESDALVEEHIRSRLEEEFPEDGFLGEEGGGAVAPRLWVVDPIDGTANFARGIPHFAISIAFVDQGRVEIGAIANPAMGETYFARRGRGATRNDAPIRAAPTKDLDSASVELGWSPRIGNDAYVRAFAAILAAGANVRRSASGTLGLAYVADGRSDAYAELHINSWDCLAGLVIAREAGARINAFLAGGGLSNGNPVLAAAPGIAVAIANATGIPLPDDGEALSLRLSS
jgi:myo-inositol-1(or 4)-monophosphatase